MMMRFLLMCVGMITVISGCARITHHDDSHSAVILPESLMQTTKVATAPVLGIHRHPDESCADHPLEIDSGVLAHHVTNPAGVLPQTVLVPADPQRIAVLAAGAADGLCVLGLQDRLVGIGSTDTRGDDSVFYLGNVVHHVPHLTDAGQIDFTLLASQKPDVIVASQDWGNNVLGQLSGIAPTVVFESQPDRWQENFIQLGNVTGRLRAAHDCIDRVRGFAHYIAQTSDSVHFQVSVVQLTHESIRIYGVRSFAGSVLGLAGVQRPVSQRFVETPYREIPLAGLTPEKLADIDGDVMYISFADSQARENADHLLDTSLWRSLSARADNRMFVVNDEIWHHGDGVIAAGGIVDDLRYVNMPLN